MPSILTRTREFLHHHALVPILHALEGDSNVTHLSWGIALAIVIGLNPFIGLTTVTMLLVAAIFRLNIVVTQIVLHLMTPLQWLLFFPFIRAGSRLFRTRLLPLPKQHLVRLLQHHPILLIRHIWAWEWHALLVWAACAAILAPPLFFLARRLLVFDREHSHSLRSENERRVPQPH